MNSIDISWFIGWFLSQAKLIWTWYFNTLSSIQFAGTNIFQVQLIVVFLTAGIPILVEVTRNHHQVERSRKVNK